MKRRRWSSRQHPFRTRLFVACIVFVENVSGFTVLPQKASATAYHELYMVQARGGEPTFNTALCVIPPEEVWDTIQRARHLARDTTYRKWPPAIRLFHPFCPRENIEDAALEVAKLIEKYDIEPFRVTLNTFAIVPHLEAIEADLEAIRQLPTQQVIRPSEKTTRVEQDIEAMIQVEEEVGRQRLKRRKARKPSKFMPKSAPESNNARTPREKISPRQKLEKQQGMYDEFNGPCIVCLELDRQSRERLEDIRQILVEELFSDYEAFSPSSSVAVTRTLPKTLEEGSFRPLIPIGGFPSVTSAISFAKKLKALWRPLAFKVSDLQFISDLLKDDSGDSREYNDRESFLAKLTLNDPTGEEDFVLSDQFGCDAAVMLMGEEIEQDDETNQVMVDILLSEGLPCAADSSASGSQDVTSALEEDDLSLDGLGDEATALLSWLDGDDDDLDEGTVIVLGRTHFFSGEMRTFDGMPAASVIDGKDRSTGTNAADRRRAASKSSWEDGDFGSRNSF